jgi:hypothetical protein
LLLSQCRHVSPPDFVPLSNADPSILSSAITLLMAENNGRSGDANILSEQMKKTGRYNRPLERNRGMRTSILRMFLDVFVHISASVQSVIARPGG